MTSVVSGAQPARRAELDDWFGFLRAECHVLREVPWLLWQRAANQPATAAGRRALSNFPEENARRPWLRRVNVPVKASACVLALAGHGDAVTSCAFSPDGRRLAAVTYHGRVKLWDIDKGSELFSSDLRAATSHRGELRCAFLAGGHRLLTHLPHGELRLWDGESGLLVADLEEGKEWGIDSAISPDGSWVVSAARDGCLRFWEAKSGRRLATFRAGDEWLVACRVFPDRSPQRCPRLFHRSFEGGR